MKCEKLTRDELYMYARATYDNHKPIYDSITQAPTIDSAERQAVLHRYRVKGCFEWIDLRQVTTSVLEHAGRDMWTEAREGC